MENELPLIEAVEVDFSEYLEACVAAMVQG
jgi:hypothetical protein